MKVLSLFDGMACGALALQKTGIEIESYDAFEIDEYAIKTATHNFPFIKQHGDVFNASFTDFEGIDPLCGGSPCFVAGTMIKTDTSIKPIEEMQVGDKVLTHKGRYKTVKDGKRMYAITNRTGMV